jgi:hypothetical protein
VTPPRGRSRRARSRSMTRDEWNEVLAIAPLTQAQRVAVHAEFARLGVADRAERLAACAALLGLDGLGSTMDLTQGQAGKLIGELRARDRGELAAVAAADDGDQDAEDGSAPCGPGWPGLLARCLHAACGRTPGRPEGTADAETHP